MTKPILVVTSRYPKEVEDRINQDYNARRNPNQFPFNQQDLLSATEGADALFITPADRLDSGFFRNVSPSIKIIATYSVGFEHIDLEAAARRKIPIAYTPGVNSEATADIAMLLLLGASRRAYEAQELVRTGAWKAPEPRHALGMASRWQSPRHFGNGARGTSCGASSARIRNEDSLLQRFGATCGNSR